MTAIKAWVLVWYCQASGKLIAARHRRILAATAVQALAAHAQHCRRKYALMTTAARHWKQTVFRALFRYCTNSHGQNDCQLSAVQSLAVHA